MGSSSLKVASAGTTGFRLFRNRVSARPVSSSKVASLGVIGMMTERSIVVVAGIMLILRVGVFIMPGSPETQSEQTSPFPYFTGDLSPSAKIVFGTNIIARDRIRKIVFIVFIVVDF